MVRIGLVQFKAERQPAHNVLKAVGLIHDAAKKGAQIICLQELFHSYYFPQLRNHSVFRLAEKIPGPTSKRFADLARRLKAVLIVPLFERTEQGRYYNSLIVLDADGRLLGKYRKMHLPNDPGFYEKYYFDRGNLGVQVFQTAYGKIGALICWDQWFPEAARSLALAGAQIIFYPTAIGSFPDRSRKERLKEKTAWEMVQRSHAIANGVFVACVNRVGLERRIRFWGGSFVCGPFGEMLGQADEKKEQILITACKFKEIRKIRKCWPFLKERRVDVYE